MKRRVLASLLAVIVSSLSFSNYVVFATDTTTQIQVESEQEEISQPKNTSQTEQQTVTAVETQPTESMSSEEELDTLEVSNLKVDITNRDEALGIFSVELSGFTASNDLKNILVPTWCEKNGQDDLVWYKAFVNQDGNYQVDINIKDHQYQTGLYKMHIYVESNINKLNCISSTETMIETKIDKMYVEKNSVSQSLQYEIKAEGVQVPGGVKNVKFAVWSIDGGQDDLHWYDARQNERGNYEYLVSLKDHKTYGVYLIHAYAVNQKNEEICIATGEFIANKPTAKAVTIEQIDKKAGTFIVRISGVLSEAGINKVILPTWCANDQNDIFSYQAKRDDKGDYLVKVDLANHKYHTGNFSMHTYIVDDMGVQSYVGQNACDMSLGSGKIDVIQHKNKKNQYDVILSEIEVPVGVNEILFAVWSADKSQDDLKWNKALTMPDGTFLYSMSITDYKSLGKYYIDAYAKTKAGELICIGATTLEKPKAIAKKAEFQSVDIKSGKFSVRISEIINGETIQEVKVPVWCQDNQSDLKWYTAVKQEDGTYVAEGNLSLHKYHTGVYKTHVYITDIVNNTYFTVGTEYKIESSSDLMSINDVDGKETNYQVKVDNIVLPGGVAEFETAVWSEEGGQNDLRWYKATKTGNGNYVCNVDIRNHKSLGKYTVHGYAKNISGERVFIKGSQFSVLMKPSGTISVNEIDNKTGAFSIVINNLYAPSGVTKIKVPVWCEANQNDIQWYVAQKRIDGSYVVNGNVDRHKLHFGKYSFHVFAEMGNGVESFIGKAGFNIKPEDFVYSYDLGGGKRKIVLLGANDTGIQEVSFPTWSNVNGQDDLVWYKGILGFDGSYSAVVDGRNHRNAGTFTTHIYMNGNKGVRFVGQSIYEMIQIQFSHKLSVFTTLSTNDANGTYNMMKALGVFNQVIVNPGQTLSFFDVAGPCGAAQGYLPAGVVGGLDYGGGICQTTTTLYGGIIRAGLTIVERKNHSVPSTYVPIGQDAMVSYGTSDLKFRNDFNFPIKLVTYAIGKTLVVEIYGNNPEWFDYVDIGSWSTGFKAAAASRAYYKQGRLVRIEALPSSYYY